MLEQLENILAPKKKDNTGLIIGIAAGTLAAAATACVTAKVVKEIKEDMNEVDFTSADGENIVTLSYGSSKLAKGLTFIKVKACTASGSDECKFAFLSRKGILSCEWQDDEHFELLVGKGKKSQCCDVDFSGDEIHLMYYLKK